MYSSTLQNIGTLKFKNQGDQLKGVDRMTAMKYLDKPIHVCFLAAKVNRKLHWLT